MQISGTFLNSKIAQRIAFLLLIAAAIPALLITVITHRTVQQLTDHYEHQSLVDTSQSYALSAFANLMFARIELEEFYATDQDGFWQPKSLWQTLGKKSDKLKIFNAIAELSAEGKVISQHGSSKALITALAKNGKSLVGDISSNKVRLVVLPAPNPQQNPIITLAMPRIANGHVEKIIVTEINSSYLWGLKADYPSDINVCAYRTLPNDKTALFCSNELNKAANDSSQTSKSGTWELFLKAEFLDDSWHVVTTRYYPKDENGILNLIGSNTYIGVSILSLLFVGLLSLIQVRRTMIPLERLIDGTRKISKGEFVAVNVDDKSEFAELAGAFNNMSADIKRQLDTLQSLSEVDKTIVTKLDVDHLIERVMSRIQQLKPNACVGVFRWREVNDVEDSCIVDIAQSGNFTTLHHTLPRQEIINIKAQGQVTPCNENSSLVHQCLMAKYGVRYVWVLPIFWQGEMCAFLSVGSPEYLVDDDSDWAEIRDLASRIGIVISALKREEQLLIQAHFDSLTGLPNRILLEDRILQAIAKSDSTQTTMWVIFLDLDRFKFINDSMGHNAGDQLLMQFAKRLQSAVSPTDTAARFGGDEFILVLQGQADENQRLDALKRTIETVCQPISLQNVELTITCSIGISVYPNDSENPEMLIKHADTAMYHAKESGKNNFQFFTQSMNEEVAKRMYMENLLRNALNRDELELYYQPKVDLQSMKIVGMEALIRWNSKELGFISPIQFIPLAEETGLILSIGEWVIRTACEQAVAWQKSGYEQLLMSVNLSARQFKQNNLAESINNILNETGLEAQHLELELTESLVMAEVESSLNILHEIKALGIKISVDDFGTGYSSLAYLKDLPLDTLKIDKSFTDNIVMHTDKAPIVQAIISLAKNLSLKVVVEGVESMEQVIYLKNHACDQMQGYYFSRPRPAAEIEKLLLIN